MSNRTDHRVILIVAYEDCAFDVVRRAFLDDSDFDGRVLRCASAGETLDLLQGKGVYALGARIRPDLVVLDLDLPGQDGMPTLNRIKSDPELRAIPVVAITASPADTALGVGYDNGANTLFAKPNSAEEVVALVRELKSYWFQAAALP